MAHAYTPGLKVSAHISHKVRRILPIMGEVMVKQGDKVGASDVVARTFLPGEITPVNMANLLSMPPVDVMECMLKKEGDRVEIGEPLAETKGIFGMFKNTYNSKHAGVIETVSSVTGQVILRGEPIPVEVKAYVTGTVTEVLPDEGVVIEAEVSFIQGIFGIGGETHGTLKVAAARHDQEVTPEMITAEMKDCIILGGARVTHKAIQKAIEVGAAGLVSGGIDDSDLKRVLGYDLGVAITGTERIGLTVVITEGFGEIAMAERTFTLLKKLEGHSASINGATQIRAGVMRPEIVVPLTAEEAAAEPVVKREAGLLEIGVPLRVIRDPYFGLIGVVEGLPPEPQVLGSGSKARVVEVKLTSGKSVVVPRANVELIEA